MAISDLTGRPQTPIALFPPGPPVLAGLGGPGVQQLPGVQTVAMPQHHIMADLQQEAQRTLDGLAPGTYAATLNVHTETGVNLVFAARVNNRLSAVAWVGKSGWHAPDAAHPGWVGAVSVRASWGG